MALKQAFNYKGIKLPESYWRVEFINHLARPDRFCIVELWGYPSAEIAAQAEADSRQAQMQIGRVEVRLHNESFDAIRNLTIQQLFGGSVPESATLYDVVASAAYLAARQYKNVPLLDENGEVVLQVKAGSEEETEPVLVSFFADAEDC